MRELLGFMKEAEFLAREEIKKTTDLGIKRVRNQVTTIADSLDLDGVKSKDNIKKKLTKNYLN